MQSVGPGQKPEKYSEPFLLLSVKHILVILEKMSQIQLLFFISIYIMILKEVKIFMTLDLLTSLLALTPVDIHSISYTAAIF